MAVSVVEPVTAEEPLFRTVREGQQPQHKTLVHPFPSHVMTKLGPELDTYPAAQVTNVVALAD